MAILESGYKSILVAVDFSELSAAVIKKAQAIAQQSNAKLEMIHVVEIPTYPVLEDVAVMGMPGVWDDEVAKTMMSASDKRIEQLAKEFAVINYKSVSGIASVDIVEYAKQHHKDLIVIGAHGLSGINVLIGSTTNAVINHAESDVLAVRPVKEVN